MKVKLYAIPILFIGFSFLLITCGIQLAETLEKKDENYTCTIPGTSIKFDMVYISGGEFDMGSLDSEGERDEDECPVHRVKVSPFWMGKTEVTWEEYECYAFNLGLGPNSDRIEAVTKPSPSYEAYDHGMGRGKKPAMGISWHAAKMYCEWLSAKTDHNYRLPTEAEWEFACRAGSTTLYSFGDDPEEFKKYAWFDKNSGGKTQEVGTKMPNAFGLYDMHGNVWEICADYYDEFYYRTFKNIKIADNPKGPEESLDPVIRGGSWNDPPSELRSANRKELPFEWWERDPQRPRGKWWFIDGPYVGLRVVRTVEK